jgi:hypothetical protein
MIAEVIQLHPPPTDAQRVAAADTARQAIADLEAVTRAKKAAAHALEPRKLAVLTPEQLAAIWRASGMRNPRQRPRPALVATRPDPGAAT